MTFKIGTNICHPEDKVRRIPKKNEQGILCIAQNYKKCAFTLAEVLITLGIIGIIAAMTLPTVIGYYQKKVLQEQFKIAYSMFSQLLLKAETDLGAKPECYYWDQNPYGGIKCAEYDSRGGCTKYVLSDGSPLPSDYNGNKTECKLLLNSILSNVQLVAKCEGKAYEKGCIPNYEGYDTVQQANYPDMSEDEAYAVSAGCPHYRKNYILNNSSVYIFKNGIIFIPYSTTDVSLFALDINGKKGPNKWGYDLFAFTIRSNNILPLKLSNGTCMTAEKGGLSTQKMIENMYSIK